MDREGLSMNDTISRQDAIDYIKECAEAAHGNHEWDMEQGYLNAIECIEELPSAQPVWNNHTVACLLAELFDDTCACNYNGIDEWLPKKCEVIDSCPNPVGVACWEQFLMHRTERNES